MKLPQNTMKNTALAKDLTEDIPDFLIKTAFGSSLIVVLLLIPFTVNNLIQDRFVMGLATITVMAACGYNVWLGFHGRYSLFLNTYLLTISTTFLISYTLFRLGTPGSYWPFLLVFGYYFVLPEKRALFFNLLALLIFIPLAWSVLDLPSAVRYTASLIVINLFAFFCMREINLLNGRLKEQAVTDKLTGLFNRHLMSTSLQHAIAQHQRTGIPMTLIALDVDHFKLINDTLGHSAGDEILKSIGDLLRKNTRSSDMVFRTGGEEFLILAHDSDLQEGVEVAEKLRQMMEQTAFLPDRQVTISVGVSCLQKHMDEDMWFKDSDEKLYIAKAGGRNRVVTRSAIV